MPFRAQPQSRTPISQRNGAPIKVLVFGAKLCDSAKVGLLCCLITSLGHLLGSGFVQSVHIIIVIYRRLLPGRASLRHAPSD